jgi:hypothetical protein
MLNIITFKTGSKYDARYVNRMYSMASRFIRVPFEFYCFTDNPIGLHPKIIVSTETEGLPGWWVKMLAFSKKMPKGDLLVLDLDQVITRDITHVIEEARGPIAVSEDPYKWHGVSFGSAFMLIRNNAYNGLYDAFIEKHPPDTWGTLDEVYSAGDQHYISQNIEVWESLDNQFPGAFLSYKKDVSKALLPFGAGVVNFHGHPKQHEALDPWIEEFWF